MVITTKSKAKSSIAPTGGKWDPKAWPVYFAASNTAVFERTVPYLSHLLLAINELEGEQYKSVFDVCFKSGKKLLIDSGVYSLSTEHAKKHHLSMNQALTMAPDQIDGFEELFARYVEIVREYGDRVWGYVEIDQGGRANKIKTRAKLEKMGLRPIPVYHPFNDGWDYFDYLASRYDRICFGNVVMADIPTRKRLCATAWERRRKYPNLWIHLLGMTPSDTTTAFPMNSCDSSTWISGQRWDQHHTNIGSSRSELQPGFSYVLGHRGSWEKQATLCGYNAWMLGRTMNNMARDAERELGSDVGLFLRRGR